MLRSPAFCLLSRAAHQILARLEIELADHGGRDNGKLPLTYAQLEEYGLHGHAIAPAIRELEALGFIEVTEQGRAGNAEFRRASKFRITYRNADRAKPTHEWRRITENGAATIAKGARRCGNRKSVKRRVAKSASEKPTLKNKNPLAESAPRTGGKRSENPVFHAAETASTSPTAETASTFDISGWAVGAAVVSTVRTTS